MSFSEIETKLARQLLGIIEAGRELTRFTIQTRFALPKR